MTDETNPEPDARPPPHRPPARRGWREILTEVGIVVLGVLIALGAEQAALAVRSADAVKVAEAAMRVELADDDDPQAYARLAIAPCLDRDLGALRAAITSHVPPQAFGALADAYRPPVRTWDMDAWASAQSSGVGNTMGSTQLLRWADAYDFIPFLQATANQERDGLNRLARTRFRSGPLTPATADELSDIVDDLALANDRMVEYSAIQLAHARNDGVGMTADAGRRLLARLRAAYGACAVEPDPERYVRERYARSG